MLESSAKGIHLHLYFTVQNPFDGEKDLNKNPDIKHLAIHTFLYADRIDELTCKEV